MDIELVGCAASVVVLRKLSSVTRLTYEMVSLCFHYPRLCWLDANNCSVLDMDRSLRNDIVCFLC